MKIQEVNPQLSVSAQLHQSDLAQLALNNVQIIVCNRPDGESDDQESFLEITQGAHNLGMRTVHIPFKVGELSDDAVDAFSDILESGKKIHAYCRTGNRSFSIFAAAQARFGREQPEILRDAKRLGFDVREVIKPYFPEREIEYAEQYNG